MKRPDYDPTTADGAQRLLDQRERMGYADTDAAQRFYEIRERLLAAPYPGEDD